LVILLWPAVGAATRVRAKPMAEWNDHRRANGGKNRISNKDKEKHRFKTEFKRKKVLQRVQEELREWGSE